MPSLISKPKDAKKKKATTLKKSSKVIAPPPDLSTEFIQESDLEEDEKLSRGSISDDEESLPENPALATPKINGKITAPAVDSDSSSGSGIESAEDSEGEDDEEEEASDAPRETSKEAKSTFAKLASSSAKLASFKAPSYKPPTGFELASVDGTSSASRLFETSNLEGKQVWYLTAPASVPISSIKELSLANIQEGNVVLSHNDNKYGVVQDPSEDVKYTKVMVPNSAKDEYCTVSRSIDQILKVKEIVQLPSVYTTSTKAVKSSARPQPPGLRMRFRPIGFSNGKLGRIGSPSPPPASINNTSDEEVEETPRQFYPPASLEREQPPASSDEEAYSTSDAEMANAPPSKSKPATKSKPQKATAKESSRIASPSLKRKHSEGGDMKVKNSSSKSTDSTNSQLNTVKKKQTSSPAYNQSVSTEAHKTASLNSKLLLSTSQIPAPKPKQSRTLPSATHTPESPANLTSVKSSNSSQMSPHLQSQVQTSQPIPMQVSKKRSRESPTEDHATGADVDAKKRKKEAKRLKREQAKFEQTSQPGEPATFSNGAGKLSSQVQNVHGEEAEQRQKKNEYKDEKKPKKRKRAEVENERVKEPVPTASKPPPILPPKRSLSTIPPPMGTLNR